MEWLHEDDVDGEWDCADCREANLMAARNCGNDYPVETPIKIIYRRPFYQCPISAIDEEALRIVNIVQLCEGGGLGGTRVPPSFFLYETAFYMNVRSIVYEEKRRIDRIKKEKEQLKARRRGKS